MNSLTSLLGRLARSRSGFAATWFALSTIATVGMSATVIDWGMVLIARRALQASSDAAALAGAATIESGAAVSTANGFSSASGQRNARVTGATMDNGYPQLKCLTSVAIPCTNSSNANAIVVRQVASVPTIFARLLGIRSFPIAATSTAIMSGGKPVPMEIAMVLDTTASMNDPNSSCSVAGATKLTCAMAGGRTMLNSLSPSVNRVALYTFPGASTAAQATKQYNCNSDSPTSTSYRNSPVYQVLPLGSDFRSSDNASSLDSNSNMTRALGGGGSGCNQGMSAPGGFGTFYGDAITSAQAALVSTGRTGVQRVIILLSDGDANATSANMPVGRSANQCQQAITAAAAAKATGTVIYSIAYGASTSATGSCSTDSPRIAACEAMRQIASDSAKFYVGNNGTASACSSSKNASTELVGVFGSIAKSFQRARLVPNSTT